VAINLLSLRLVFNIHLIIENSNYFKNYSVDCSLRSHLHARRQQPASLDSLQATDTPITMDEVITVALSRLGWAVRSIPFQVIQTSIAQLRLPFGWRAASPFLVSVPLFSGRGAKK
jgi:hypothetical protein